MNDIIFVGLDVHKATVAVAVAEGTRGGEVRQLGAIPNRADQIAKLVEKLGKNGRRLNFCYEAGPCGYGLHRQLTALGHDCMVVAPSLIPVKAGDRVKSDRRDAVMLAKLHRAGELTAVWVPDGAHEAMRDLIRARATAVRVLGKACQHLQGFLLRHGRVYAGKKGWTLAYRRWLTTVRFDHPAQQIVLQDYIHAVTDAEARVERLTCQIKDLVPQWSMAPVVEALQAMRDDWPLALRYSFASGSVVEAWVWFDRFSPRKSRSALRPGLGGLPPSSLGLKLFIDTAGWAPCNRSS